MKRSILLALCLTALNLEAKPLSDTEILNLYANAKEQGISVSIEKRKQLDDIKDIEAVILKFSQRDKSQFDVVFFKDQLMFPEILDTKKEISYKNKIMNEIAQENIAKVYRNEKAENILKIGNDKKKPTIVMFSDPECPFCRVEVEKINESIKTHNIELIFTPVHQDSAHQKAALILKDAKGKKDADKIAILKKYYANDAKVEIVKTDVDMISANAKKYFDAGLTSVPRTFLKSDLTKK